MILDSDKIEEQAEWKRVQVTNATELEEAIADAGPGQIIELADGEYDSGGVFRIRQVNGTEQEPFIVKAQNQGKAVLTGHSWIMVEDSTYVVIEGLRFETIGVADNMGVRLQDTYHSRVTRNEFALQLPAGTEENTKYVFVGSSKWEKKPVDTSMGFVYVWHGYGGTEERNRIDHNRFVDMLHPGNFVAVDAPYVQIDHNEFRNIPYRPGTNGLEAVRIGNSQKSLVDFHAIIEHNLFVECRGENEIISIKSGANQIRYNTFVNNWGTLSLRHGNGNDVYGNFFFGEGESREGGVRIFNADNKVYNNYFEGLGGSGMGYAALIIRAGNVDEPVKEEDLGGGWRVKRSQVAFNTFVDNKQAINISSDEANPYMPIDTTVANNIVVGGTGAIVIENVGEQPSGITWTGNIINPGRNALLLLRLDDKTEQQIRIEDPLLAHNGLFYQISKDSPAVGAAMGTWDFLEDDLVGFARKGALDIGASQYQEPPGKRQPLTPELVGPNR